MNRRGLLFGLLAAPFAPALAKAAPAVSANQVSTLSISANNFRIYSGAWEVILDANNLITGVKFKDQMVLQAHRGFDVISHAVCDSEGYHVMSAIARDEGPPALSSFTTLR